MVNNYLAKSNPVETIQQHTDNLIKNFNILKSIYPNLKINWDILYLACLYHDLGKMNRKFQDKIERRIKQEDEIPHGILSLSFVNTKELKNKGIKKDEIKILVHSIAYHHERDLDYSNNLLEQEVELLKDELDDFIYEKADSLQIKKIGARYFSKDRIYQKDNDKMFFDYIMIKGLLNRIDYAASGYIDVEKENDFLVESLSKLIERWKEKNQNAQWNDLQNHMILHRENNVIAIAQTGMGKTEAGLLWIGDNKGFFTLPLKTAINAMYKRIASEIIKDDFETKIGLLHSDTYSEYLKDDPKEIDIDEYYNKTKQLSLPLTICTLDQIFDFVYRYRGFESKLATLAYSKIVIDEVQMYSSDLLAYLILGLYYITKLGGKFAILTATLPSLVIDLLQDEEIEFTLPKTFTNNEKVRHSVKVVKERIKISYILDLYKKNKVLVICNTVKEAQRIYKELEGIEDVTLFHSNFIKRDRKEKEDKILQIGKRHSKEHGIWVTTQVVEASLDIDFDILVTELSDLNGLFQRLGRCYRNREYKGQGHNCYVFNGGEKECSGVGYVIDKDIFNLSKQAIERIDGKLYEEEKMRLVSELYTTDKLRNTEYYKAIKSTIDYVKSIDDHEKGKSEVKKIFRNINALTVIPKGVYRDNHIEVREYIKTLSQEYSKDMSQNERKKMKSKKAIDRSKLMEFTVSISNGRFKGSVIENIQINKYESIPIFDCEYSKKLGVQYIERKSSEKNSNNFI
ncbi:CRISPR-associated helicase Cas3' [Wukongibacter sp. M2B1]|uniref:CRISPR-associated helicase Cas3' n=1 Tax=Wukongibacter sp. M2B1 TaxID=3088895 RepID=UPI003D7A23D6